MFAVSVRIRAEKSEVLNEYEQNLERRVELLKTVCQTLHKKVISFLRSQGPSTDVEKRLVRWDSRIVLPGSLMLTRLACSCTCVYVCVQCYACMCTCTVHVCLFVCMYVAVYIT